MSQMKLSKYLSRPGAAAKLALAVGVSHTSVQRWRDGESVPRKHHMAAIVAVTKGRVRVRDFYE